MAMKKKNLKFYKAFNATYDENMKLTRLDCRGMQFKVGKKVTNESKHVELCKSGIHFCSDVVKVNGYYTIARSNQALAEIVPSGKMDHSYDKSCSRSITVKKLLPYWKAYLKVKKSYGHTIEIHKANAKLWVSHIGSDWFFNIQTDSSAIQDNFFSCKNDIGLHRNNARFRDFFHPKNGRASLHQLTLNCKVIKIPVECTIIKTKNISSTVNNFFVIDDFKTIEDVIKEFKKIETLQNKTKKK